MAIGGDRQVSLSWEKTQSVDTVVVRFPGEVLVYTGPDEEFVDTGVVNGTDYVYSAFALGFNSERSVSITAEVATIPAGLLDTDFSNSGRISSDILGNDDEGHALAFVPGGDIVVVGQSTSTATGLAIWIATEAGSVFVSERRDLGVNLAEVGYAVDTDGETIFAAGFSEDPGTRRMTVWRYSLDGVAGPVFVDAVGKMSEGLDVLARKDRVYIAGAIAQTAGNPDAAIWKFNPDTNTPDETFGTGGLATHDGAAGGRGSAERAHGIAEDADGNLCLAGSAESLRAGNSAVAWRFDSAGQLDTGFGTGGVFADGQGRTGVAEAMAIDPQTGRIALAGFAFNGLDDDVVVWSVDSNGAEDNITHHDGIPGMEAFGNDVAIDGRGNVVVVGATMNTAGDEDAVVWRFLPDGSIDEKFGLDGMVVLDEGQGRDETAFAVEIDDQGRIVVAGRVQNGSNNFDLMIWRLLP